MRTLLLAFFVFALSAQSQPPSPTPTKSAQKEQQTESGKQSKTEPSKKASGNTVAIRASSSDQHTANSNNGGDRKQNESTSDWWLVRFTGALAIVGFLQLIAIGLQAVYLWRGLSIGKQQADAASKSAAAAVKSADAAQSSADTARQSSESAAATATESARISAATLDALQAMATAQENANKLRVVQSQLDWINRSPDH